MDLTEKPYPAEIEIYFQLNYTANVLGEYAEDYLMKVASEYAQLIRNCPA